MATKGIAELRRQLAHLLSNRKDNQERVAQANAEIARQRRRRSRSKGRLKSLHGRIHKLRHRIKVAQSAPIGAQRAIHWAAARVGTTEHPPGSNGGPLVSKWQAAFGFGRVPWCGIFVGTALRHAGVKVDSRIAGVSLIEEDAKASRGPFTGWGTARSAVPGDAVVLFGYGVHVELVVANHGTFLETIGGNTSFGNGSQSNGGCVARRTRPYSDVRGIAHVRY
jgi:hypothetical protein